MIQWKKPRVASAMRPRHGLGLAVGLALPGLEVVRWIQRVMVAVTVLLAALAGWWWVDSMAMEEEVGRFESATTRTQALTVQMSAQMAQAGLTLTAEQTAHVRMDVAFLNQLAGKRAFSWVQLFDDLESTEPLTVAIMSVKVNFQDSTVLLSGTAPDLQTLNSFVTALQQHRAFRKVSLVNHQIREDGVSLDRSVSRVGFSAAAGPIEFSLEADYRVKEEEQD